MAAANAAPATERRGRANGFDTLDIPIEPGRARRVPRPAPVRGGIVPPRHVRL